MRRSSAPTWPRPLPIILTDAEGRSGRFRDTPLCDASPELVPIVDQKLTIGVEERRGLVLPSNGLSGLSPTDFPLVDNRREKSGVTRVCLLRILARRMMGGKPRTKCMF